MSLRHFFINDECERGQSCLGDASPWRLTPDCRRKHVEPRRGSQKPSFPFCLCFSSCLELLPEFLPQIPSPPTSCFLVIFFFYQTNRLEQTELSLLTRVQPALYPPTFSTVLTKFCNHRDRKHVSVHKLVFQVS